jgi:hypothetical protein
MQRERRGYRLLRLLHHRLQGRATYIDKATLRACSLTCRAFLPARLFYHVVLEHAAKWFLNIICYYNGPTSCLSVHSLSLCLNPTQKISNLDTFNVLRALSLLSLVLLFCSSIVVLARDVNAVNHWIAEGKNNYHNG